MPQKITESAQSQCDKGTTPSFLQVNSQDFSKADDKLIATEEDKTYKYPFNDLDPKDESYTYDSTVKVKILKKIT